MAMNPGPGKPGQSDPKKSMTPGSNPSKPGQRPMTPASPGKPQQPPAPPAKKPGQK